MAALTPVPAVINGDDLTDAFTLGVRTSVSEMQAMFNTASTTVTSWTPTFTNVTLGNGGSTGRYYHLGPLVIVEFAFFFGSTSAFTSTVGLTLPFATGHHPLGACTYRDAGTRLYTGTTDYDGSSAGCFFVHSESGNLGYVNATNPFTWGNGDQLRGTIVYTQ